jgi:hypothetical protein
MSKPEKDISVISNISSPVRSGDEQPLSDGRKNIRVREATMREPEWAIEAKLCKLGLPYRYVAKHIESLERWRAAHPQKIKRKRLGLSAYEAKPREERERHSKR